MSTPFVDELANGYRTLTFVATLSEAAASSFYVSYRTIGGTATAELDYSPVTNGFLHFDTGGTSNTFTVTVLGDTLNESDESIEVELFNPGGGIQFAGDQPTLRTTGVIRDDDGGAAGNLAFFVSDPQIVEGDSGTRQAIFELRLSRPSAGPVTVDYATADGTAVAGSDYVARTGSVTFAAGQLAATVAVNVVSNMIAEPSEAFFLKATPRAGTGLAATTGMATILDDDSGGGVPVLSVTAGTVTEFASGYHTITFVATLSEAATSPFYVYYRTVGGTATAGIDYTAETGRGIYFEQGETSQTFTVTVLGDTLDESDEFIGVELFNPGGGVVFERGQPTLRATGVIQDDDGGATGNLTLFVSDPLLVEGDSGVRQAIFELRLSRPATTPMIVDFATADGTALAGSDYVARSGSLVFAAGQDTAYVTVNVASNVIAEPSEAFFLNVTPRAATGLAATSGTATILDDDSGGGLPVISVTAGALAEFANGYHTLTFTATLSEAAASPFYVYYRTLGGTATAGVDYTAETNRGIYFEQGETSQTFTVVVLGDTLNELDESIGLELFNPGGGLVFEGGQPTLRTTGVIRDDDGGADGNLALLVSDPQIVEGDGGVRQAIFELRLSRPAAGAVTVDFATANGSALAGSDYTARAGSVTFAAGQDTAYVAVNLLSDAVAEASEAFFLNVTPRPGAGFAAASGTATILDDDSGVGVPVLSVTPGTLTEFANGYAAMTFTATLSEAAAAPFYVYYRTIEGTATAGVDYTPETNRGIYFEQGETSNTFTVTVLGDTLNELDESIGIELFNAGGGVVFAGGQPTLRTSGVIQDDDGGADGNLALFVSNPQIVEGDSGVRQAIFEVRLSRPPTTPVTVDFATTNGSALAGSDYVAKSGSLTFAAGQDTAYVAVNIASNAISEPSETFFLNVTPRPGTAFATATGAATILDDDSGVGVPVLSVSAGALTEFANGYHTMTFVATLSEVAAAPFYVYYRTVGGTATAGVDYTAETNRGIYFEAGETSNTFTVTVLGDTAIEPNETVVVELFNIGGGNSFAGGGQTLQTTGVILNDDAPPVGGAGNEAIDGTPAADLLQGGDGNDTLNGLGGTDSLLGGGGNDTLDGGTGSDTLDGGPGTNILRGGEGDDFYVLDATPDSIVEVGNAGIDTVLLTGAGAAPAFALGFNLERVIVLGGPRGVTGNALDNALTGGAGADTLAGATGNDTLDGGAGVDRLLGGAGDDFYLVTASDVVVEALNQGADTVMATSGAAFALSANVETLLLGGSAAMNGVGNALGNRIEGNAAANVLTGAGGADTLLGGEGADVLIGGAGKDWLTGGIGNDQFRLVAASESTAALPDVILDFTAIAGQELDRVDLRAIDANPFVAGDQAFGFIGAAAFGGAGAASAGQLRVQLLAAGEYRAEADLDGNGMAEIAVEIHATAGAPAASWFLL